MEDHHTKMNSDPAYRARVEKYLRERAIRETEPIRMIVGETRTSVSLRMNKSFHSGFAYYCKRANITLGEFYEQAGLLFMKLYPVEGITINDKTEERNL